MELKHIENRGITPVYCLLIVPYGIETNLKAGVLWEAAAFNRTLWN